MCTLNFDYRIYTENRPGADPKNLDPVVKAEFEKRMNEKYAEHCEIINSYHGVIKVSVSTDGMQIIASSLLIDHPIPYLEFRP